MLKFLIIPMVFLLIMTSLSGQVSEGEHFQAPLKIPLFLSGNFGELRSTHFHAGLDFKTQSVIGHPVYAAAEGYVSRIKIQSGGYGQSIYITHPNGYTTLYAHLNNFTPEIQKYVSARQYRKQSYELDITDIPKDKFEVKMEQLIGYSGNTGRSGGPHLHFEIRRTMGQIPVNGLKFGFPVTDDIPPEFRSFYYYAYRNHEPNNIQLIRGEVNSLVKKQDAVYSIAKEIEIDGAYLGFGAEVYDFLNGSNNKCGVYEMQLFIDEQAFYSFTINEISFAQTRFINAHMDYGLKISEGKSVHRLFALPYNELPIYAGMGSNGIFTLRDFESHKARIIAIDAYGNKSSLEFSFRRKKEVNYDFFVPDINYLVEWRSGRNFTRDGLTIEIPAKALYQDIDFSYEIVKGKRGVFSDSIYIHTDKEPLHRDITVKYKIDSVPDSLKSKLLFARINGKGKLISGGGEYEDGELKFQTRSFGKYVITLDSLAPEIKFLGVSKSARRVSFTISDDLSGIKSYNGYIDEEWALFSFDSKSGTLSYEIDADRVPPGVEHTVRLIVSDYKDNSSVFNKKLKF